MMSDFNYLQGLLDSGPRVTIPPGEYATDQTLRIDRTRQTVEADGVVIRTTAPWAFRLGTGAGVVTDVTLAGPTLFGGGVEMFYCLRANLYRLKVRDCAEGVRMTRTFQCCLRDSDLRRCASAGVLVEGEGNDQYLSDVRIVGDLPSPGSGVVVRHSRGLWMDNVGVVGCLDGFRLSPGPGESVEYVFTTRCSADLGKRYGWHLIGTQGTVRGWTSTSDWASSNAWSGLLAQNCTDLTVSAMRILNNLQHGLHLVSCKDSAVNLCTASGNGSALPGSYHGLVLDHCDGVRVSDNRSGQIGDYAHTQGFGLFEVGSVNVWKTNNDFRRNLNG